MPSDQRLPENNPINYSFAFGLMSEELQGVSQFEKENSSFHLKQDKNKSAESPFGLNVSSHPQNPFEDNQPTPSATPDFGETKKESSNVEQSSPAKEKNIYGMTLDKYFGSNFKSISINEKPAQKQIEASEKQYRRKRTGELSSLENQHSQESYLGLGGDNMNTSFKGNPLNGSGRFGSNEQIYEEDGNSYSGGEDFAIAEEEEDENNLSNGSAQFGIKAKGVPVQRTDVKKKSYVYGEGRKSNRLNSNKENSGKAHAPEKRNNKFMDEREPKPDENKQSHSVKNRNNSIEQEARETSIKEKIEKKYKTNKKHHGGNSYGPSLQGRGYSNGLSINPYNQNSSGSVEANSTQNQFSFNQTCALNRTQKKKKSILNQSTEDPYEDPKQSSRAWGRREPSEEMRSGGSFYTTSNGGREPKSKAAHFQHMPQCFGAQSGMGMYVSKHEGFDPKASVYNQTNKTGSTFLPSSGKNTSQGFGGGPKQMGSSRMEFSTNVYDPTQQILQSKKHWEILEAQLNLLKSASLHRPGSPPSFELIPSNSLIMPQSLSCFDHFSRSFCGSPLS